MSSPVMAATKWKNNAEMIADVARLGYIKEDDLVLDPTYGRGLWWKEFEPCGLVSSDIAADGIDFRHLPLGTGKFDVVAFDPPYVCKGGRETSTIPDFNDRYGLEDAPKTPALLQELINDGLTECTRVVKVGGYILCKVQNYISSGKLWRGTYWTEKHATEVLGLECVEQFTHVGNVRPQPPGRAQKHARNNASTLFIFKKKAVKS